MWLVICNSVTEVYSTEKKKVVFFLNYLAKGHRHFTPEVHKSFDRCIKLVSAKKNSVLSIDVNTVVTVDGNINHPSIQHSIHPSIHFLSLLLLHSVSQGCAGAFHSCLGIRGGFTLS